MVEIRPFQKSDAEQVVTTMAAAFANDALYRYFVEEEAERKDFWRNSCPSACVMDRSTVKSLSLTAARAWQFSWRQATR